MESNIKGLVAAGYEMASELKAECGAVDMRSVAKLISDLATQLEVQLVRANALAAENAGLKAICDDRRRFIMNGVQMGYIKVPAAETDPDLETIRIAISPQKPIPATDAFLAEVRAQGVDMARNAMIDFVDGEVGPNKNVPGLIRGAEICVSIAEQLRKGGNQ
ncbi:eae-like domain protein [Escherichia coli]|uniref:eae-like domain protein n=1 Tax=Escherichia coli TaxID=562 RepID=UPI00234E128B|nr:eae-like domain protein [Escherichia coli]MDC6965547.1 eae-like domain protein [Escherichia coli]